MCLQVKRNLHMVLSFSPVGGEFRERLRKFPSLVNCTTIDWFSEWPRDALHTVATQFLADLPGVDAKVSSKHAASMAQRAQHTLPTCKCNTFETAVEWSVKRVVRPTLCMLCLQHSLQHICSEPFCCIA